jgi:hypothetical protein
MMLKELYVLWISEFPCNAVLALPSNILDLTQIENKDADSAWFTPLKEFTKD